MTSVRHFFATCSVCPVDDDGLQLTSAPRPVRQAFTSQQERDDWVAAEQARGHNAADAGDELTYVGGLTVPDQPLTIARLEQALTRIDAAGGAIAHPGDTERLHAYWTRGEGLAKWAADPHPWTALYHHLVKFMDPDKAKRTAAQWFHDVKGYWPGDQKGKNPVGPG